MKLKIRKQLTSEVNVSKTKYFTKCKKRIKLICKMS